MKRGLIISSGLFAAFVLLSASFFFFYSISAFKSVELGLSELSPKGESGGYAMPASGASPPTYCTLTLDPSTVDSGESFDATVDWNLSTVGGVKYVKKVEVYRGSTQECLKSYSNNGPITGSYECIIDSSDLDTNSYAYTAKVTSYDPTGVRGTPNRCNSEAGTCETWGVNVNQNPSYIYGKDVTRECAAVLTVENSAPPTVNLEVQNTTTGSDWTGSDLTINVGEEVALKWTSTGATSCSGTNFTACGTSGTQTTVTEPALSATTQYTVTCTGPGGTAYDWLSVTADGDGPEIDTDKTIVNPGSEVTINWNLNDADPASCQLIGPGGFSQSSLTESSGSETVIVNSESLFIIQCGDQGSAEVTVKVLPVIQET